MSLAYPYLGKPGAMRALPAPRPEYVAAPAMGETVHTLTSGGTAVTRLANVKRAYTLPYSLQPSAAADLLLGFYQGLFGRGPWCFVDPTVRNVLTVDAATCGVRSFADDGWVPSAGTLVQSGTAPDDAVVSGVLAWTGTAGNATLQPGTVAATADTASAPVWLPGEFCAATLWVKAASAQSMSLILAGFDASGAAVSTSLVTAFTSSTVWQRVRVVAEPGEPGLASAVYVLPRLKLGGTAPTSVSIAGAQLEYAPLPSDWQPGFGSPRVVITSTVGRSVNLPGYTDHTLTLAEV